MKKKADYSSLYLQSNMEIRRGEKPELSSEDETMPTFLHSCKDLAVYGERRISGSL